MPEGLPMQSTAGARRGAAHCQRRQATRDGGEPAAAVGRQPARGSDARAGEVA